MASYDQVVCDWCGASERFLSSSSASSRTVTIEYCTWCFGVGRSTAAHLCRECRMDVISAIGRVKALRKPGVGAGEQKATE